MFKEVKEIPKWREKGKDQLKNTESKGLLRKKQMMKRNR